MEKILVSACLLGQRVRYDGGGFDPLQQLLAWQAQGRLVVVCPEVAGGLPTPRSPAEIPGGQGALVLKGERPVRTDQGEDVTQAFVRGAEQGRGAGTSAWHPLRAAQGAQSVLWQCRELRWQLFWRAGKR